jgi:hypothetical protein
VRGSTPPHQPNYQLLKGIPAIPTGAYSMQIGHADARRLQLLGQFYDLLSPAFLEATGVRPGDTVVEATGSGSWPGLLMAATIHCGALSKDLTTHAVASDRGAPELLRPCRPPERVVIENPLITRVGQVADSPPGSNQGRSGSTLRDPHPQRRRKTITLSVSTACCPSGPSASRSAASTLTRSH